MAAAAAAAACRLPNVMEHYPDPADRSQREFRIIDFGLSYLEDRNGSNILDQLRAGEWTMVGPGVGGGVGGSNILDQLRAGEWTMVGPGVGGGVGGSNILDQLRAGEWTTVGPGWVEGWERATYRATCTLGCVNHGVGL